MKTVLIGLLCGLILGGLFYATYETRPELSNTTCLSDCQTRGYDTSYCRQRCSLDPNSKSSLPSAMNDPMCMKNCQDSGQKDEYCNKTCRYQ